MSTKEPMSALMDGELDERAAGEAIQQMRQEGEGLDTWRIYPLITPPWRANNCKLDPAPGKGPNYFQVRVAVAHRRRNPGVSPGVGSPTPRGACRDCCRARPVR